MTQIQVTEEEARLGAKLFSQTMDLMAAVTNLMKSQTVLVGIASDYSISSLSEKNRIRCKRALDTSKQTSDEVLKSMLALAATVEQAQGADGAKGDDE